MTDAYGSLHFSAFFQPVSCWFWCHLTTCCEDKEIEWRLLNVNHSLVILILLLFIMVLVDLWKGLIRIRLWGRMCVPYVKECFLTAIPQSFRRNIQPCIVSSIDFSFKIIFIDWQKCGFYVSIYTDLIICASESLTELCLIELWPPSLHLRPWSTELVSS